VKISQENATNEIQQALETHHPHPHRLPFWHLKFNVSACDEIVQQWHDRINKTGGYHKGNETEEHHKGNKTEEYEHDKNHNSTEEHHVLNITHLTALPVFPGGHQFSFNSSKEHPHKGNKTFEEGNSGPAQVVFTYPDKVFCGIVAFSKVGDKKELVFCDH
jgi:hypothetical protein